MVRLSRVLALVLVVAFLFAAPLAGADTQDFTLVNETGVDVYSLFISETDNDNWGDDVLGADVLLDGERIDIHFSGYSNCLWDMLVTDADGEGLTWQGINLCESSVVVLRCDDEECWAEYE